MLIRMRKHYHREPKTILRATAFSIFGLLAGAFLQACSHQAVHGPQITGASPIRHGQQFETQVVSGTAQRCIIRTKLPEQRLPGSWLDDRNSALRAALETAATCCMEPKLTMVEDWMVGFSAYEATFSCD